MFCEKVRGIGVRVVVVKDVGDVDEVGVDVVVLVRGGKRHGVLLERYFFQYSDWRRILLICLSSVSFGSSIWVDFLLVWLPMVMLLDYDDGIDR